MASTSGTNSSSSSCSREKVAVITDGTSGKVAVITGGTSGIAFGIAQEMIPFGFTRLILTFFNNIDGAANAKNTLEDDFAEVEVKLVKGNIAEEANIALIFDAVDEFGRLDAVIHSAGTGMPGNRQQLGDGTMLKPDDADVDFEDFDYYQSVYPKAFTRLIEHSLTRIPEGQQASFVAISSPGCNATQDVPNISTYDLRGMAKATLEMLVRYYGKRLALRNITVNAVIPGTVFTKAWANVAPPGVGAKTIFDEATKTIPMQRGANAREIGAAVAFLCSDKARYITGVALPVDGGLHLGAVERPYRSCMY